MSEKVFIEKGAAFLGIMVLGAAIGDNIEHNNPYFVYGGAITGILILISVYIFEYYRKKNKEVHNPQWKP